MRWISTISTNPLLRLIVDLALGLVVDSAEERLAISIADLIIDPEMNVAFIGGLTFEVVPDDAEFKVTLPFRVGLEALSDDDLRGILLVSVP